MSLAPLLPHFAGPRLTRLELVPDELRLEVVPTATSARCPACHRRSRRIHGRSTRTIIDQPSAHRRLAIRLQVRCFCCRPPACPRTTFADPTPRLAGLPTPAGACPCSSSSRTSA